MTDAIPTLSISTEKICFVVMKAREFDVKDVDTSFDDDGSNPADDAMTEVLEDRPDDPVDQELVAFIEAMSEDEQVDLVTLTWLGRGDGTLADQDDLRAEAACAQETHGIVPAWRTPFARLFGRGSRGVRPFVRRV